MRIGVAALNSETNTFSPQLSDLDYFRENGFLLDAEEILGYHHAGVRNEIAGFITESKKLGADLVPLYAAWAVAHGKVTADAYEAIKTQILSRLGAALPLDAVYLCLHGAMVAEEVDDPEGNLLAAVRDAVGETPIAVSLDFHGNITGEIVRHSDILVSYNSFPHDNLFEVGEKTARLLHRFGKERQDLVRAFIKLPLITPMERMTIADNAPMRDLIAAAADCEDNEGIVSAAVFGVQPWLDIPELGSSVVVTARRDHREEAEECATRLAGRFWEARHHLMDIDLYDPADALREALRSDQHPILLNEPADNVGAGATGDSTFILRELLKLETPPTSLVTICDPQAVEKCTHAGVGRAITLSVGGTFNTRFDSPIEIVGTVRTLFDGRYRYQGPVQNGVMTSMGRTAVVEVSGTISVQLTEISPYTIDPEHYRCVGLHPERAKIVGIKSQGSFKAAYNAISKDVYYLNTPGVSMSDVGRIPFSRVETNQLFPMNQHIDFRPKPRVYGQ